MAELSKQGKGGDEPKHLVRSAMDLLSGADQTEYADADKPEFPGLWSFMRKNWRSEAEAGGGFFRRYGRLNRKYQEAKGRESGNLRTYATIAQSAALSKEFLALLFASCIIATTGLFQGSTAVVIGGMLIAPLMMPILGFALATVWGDRRLVWRSLGTLLIGSAMVLAVASALTMMVPGMEVNNEIRGRINPNLYDILIALASGLIGAYAYANPRISSSIAGVSIAVALMPPLCTVGIGLGAGDSKIAVGALLLYLSNLFGISLAASLVFWRLRVHPMTESEDEVGSRARRNVALTALLLVAVALPLGYFMRQSYAVKKLDDRVRHALQEDLAGSELLSLTIRRFGDRHEIRSVVIVPATTAQEQIDRAKSRVESLAPENTSLSLYILRPESSMLPVAAAPENPDAAAEEEPPAPAAEEPTEKTKPAERRRAAKAQRRAKALRKRRQRRRSRRE